MNCRAKVGTAVYNETVDKNGQRIKVKRNGTPNAAGTIAIEQAVG
jgi:hypothetical protein